MENTFKQIVLIQIILLPVLIVLDIFFAVPEDISNLPYFEGAVADMSDGALIISLIVALVLLIAHYVSCFLIYFFKSAFLRYAFEGGANPRSTKFSFKSLLQCLHFNFQSPKCVIYFFEIVVLFRYIRYR